jgi:glycerophosphoryl diester phosphodiesterase
MTGRPLVLGHRGMPLEHPENSRAGHAHAIEAGADGPELDVRTTLDGRLVVQHDLVPLRTMRCPLPVPWTPLAVLRLFRLANGERIPLLADILAATAAARVVVIDVKDERSAAGVARVAAADDPRGERIHVWSSYPRAIRTVRSLAPAAPTALLLDARRSAGDPLALVQAARDAGAAGVNLDPPHHSDATVRAVVDAGLDLWSGTTTLEGVEGLVTAWRAGLPLAGFTCDHPDDARRLVDQQ